MAQSKNAGSWKRAAAIAGLAAALAIVFLARRDRASWRWPGSQTERPELQELFTALAREPERPVEGRLAGGLAYAPAPPETRGALASQRPPDVRIAAARIEKVARQNGTARNQAALGAAYLATGEWDRAVQALEEAAEQESGNAFLQNDLSAAYLARAAHTTHPESWVSGLAAANRAITLDRQRPEPYFNRALAFRGLHLPFEEGEAWTDHQRVERNGSWRAEADQRKRSVRVTRLPLTDFDHQGARERIEDQLLSQWGAAVEQNRPSAGDLLAQAGDLANRLATDGGDVMARDEVARIKRLQSAGDRTTLRELALGHRLYGEAREVFVRDKLAEASTLMSGASDHLRRAGSPYWYAAPIVRAIILRNRDQSQAALDELKTVSVAGLPPEDYFVRGRLAWIESLVQARLGRYDRARDLLTHAVEAFSSAGEADNLIATQTNLAEAEWFLGERDRAWAQLVAAFSQVERAGTTRRVAHFDLAAKMSLGDGLPEAAVDFQAALARIVPTSAPLPSAQAHLGRAQTMARAGDSAAATQEIGRATQSLAGMADAGLRELIAAEIEITQAELFSRTDCRQARSHSDAALAYLKRAAGTIRLGSVLTVRAKCRLSLGDTRGAKEDLLAALDAFETRRAVIATAADRLQAFELERTAFKDLIALEVVTLGDEAAGLRSAERARAGVLAETWGRRSGDPADHREIPPDVVVVYYETLADRTLVWVLTQEGRVPLTRPVGEAALRASVKRILRAIQEGADLSALRPVSAGLFDALIAPALKIADARALPGRPSKSRLVFIPDGPLFALPFAALPDPQGRPLLETRHVTVAPSLMTLLAASTRLATFTAADVLAVGDGHDAQATGLPILAAADQEAIDVGRIYPRSVVLTGGMATKRRFLAARAGVIHFAGHSVLNERYPMFSRMLLAPDAGAGDSGWLLGSEITPDRFDRTRVVMLATCEGAAGRPVEGEGAISVARAFFAAGVPAVVASLWPVGDDVQTLVQTFHRTLKASGDPAGALRAGQRAMLDERGPRAPVRVWGGFMMLGGLSPAPRGEQTWLK